VYNYEIVLIAEICYIVYLVISESELICGSKLLISH
jgi:hypothetical protein